MADTSPSRTFVDGQGRIYAAWLNGVNRAVYNVLGGAQTAAEARSALGVEPYAENDVRAFGAVAGQNGLDEFTAALAAYDEVLVPDGTFHFTSPLAVGSGKTLVLSAGTVLSWESASSGNGGITVSGTSAATTTLSSNAAKGDVEISVTSASQIAAGRLLRIWSTEVFDSGRTDSLVGELVEVKDISGTTVTLASPLTRAYLTSATASVEVIVPAENVTIRGGKLVGPTTDNNASIGISFYRARSCFAVGVRTERFDLAHIQSRDAVNCAPIWCLMSDVITSTTGYGFSVKDAARDCVASELYVSDCRHAFTTSNTTSYGGIPLRCGVDGGLVEYTARASLGLGTGGDALDTHAAAEDVIFRRVTVVGATGQGVNIECPTATVENCTILGPLSHGIGVHNESTQKGRVTVRGNKVSYPGRDGSGTVGDGIKISSGNNASAVGYEWVEILENRVEGCPLNHVRFGVDATRTVESGRVVGNLLDARGSGATVNQIFYATNSHNLVVRENKVFADVATQSGYRLTSCDNLRVLDNVAQMADSSTAAAVWIDGTSARPVVGRVAVVAASASSLDGIVIGDDVTSATVLSGNDLADCNVTITRGTGTSNYIEDAAQPFSTTISGGAIAVYYDTRLVTVDTEAAAASDDLDTISGGMAGQIIVVQSAGNARDIVAKNGTGNLRLGADKTLDNTQDKLALLCTGSEWHHIAIGDNNT